MSKQPNVVKIELTELQRKQIKDASGEEISSLEFSADQLEDRVAPLIIKMSLQ
ncbi:MAG: hypothetical protein WEE89_18950 [Gemmatimonadota bacterium]